MDFNTLKKSEEGYTVNPYGYKIGEDFFAGEISVSFLNENFGGFETAEEMINATESEGLKLYFAWLRDKGILE